MSTYTKPILYFIAVIGIAVIGYFFYTRQSVERQDRRQARTQHEERRQRQLESLPRFSVFHDFRFSDAIAASNISFVNRMLHAKNHYDHGTGVAVADVDRDGLLDIYFVSQLGDNELWRNVGGGKFENITDAADVGTGGKVSIGASFADTDNDGDQDLYVTTVRGGNVLLENLGNGKFQDISQKSGTDYVGHSSGAFFFDYDNDGWLDLFVTNVGRYTYDGKTPEGAYEPNEDSFEGHLHPELSERSVLFKNMGGNRFRDVTEATGLADLSWSGDADFANLNGDTYPDVYIANMQGDDHYYESQDGRSFVERTERYFLKTPWGTMGIKFFDYDNDGFMDLYLTDMHSDMMTSVPEPNGEKSKSKVPPDDPLLQGGDNNVFGNAFYKNLGNGKFQELSQELGLETFWPWGVSVGDINADGYEDVFVSAGMGAAFRYGANSLLLNNRGEGFLDSEYLVGIEPRPGGEFLSRRVTIACDGRYNLGRCLGRSGRTITVHATKSSVSAAIFDLDNDGDLDIVTNSHEAAPQIFTSDLAERKRVNFLKIELVGTAANRNGLGATVAVHAGGATYTRYVDGKSGYFSQSQIPLYFGLGEHARVERVEIIWPNGTKQVLTEHIPVNGILTISEPR